MNLKLETLRTYDLTTMEVGQLMDRHLNDLSTIAPALLTNEPYNEFVFELKRQYATYQKALLQARKNEETVKIKNANTNRDRAIDAFSKALKLYAVSDDFVEVEASRTLGVLFGRFMNQARISYQTESMGLDKLVNELESGHYAEKVALLNIQRYVVRLKETNRTFKALFSNRMVTEATNETYDLPDIRKEMLKQYDEFTAYVLAMAKALDTPLYKTALSLLNTTRKYYADLLARRATVKEVKAQPVL